MKRIRLSSPLLAAFLAALVFSACEKEKIDNGDQDFPIELTVTKTGRNVSLSWTKTNLSDFGGYFLLSSTEPIPNSPEPAGAFEVIDDFEVNSFEHTNFPLAEKIYYKVYAKRGDRFFFSPTVSIELDVKLLDIQAQNMVYSPAQKALFILDAGRSKIFRYDFASGEVTHELDTDFGGFNYTMAVGDAGQGEELVIARQGSFSVEIYDAANLQFKDGFSGTGWVSGIEVGYGAVFLATDNFSSPLTVHARGTLQVIEAGQVTSGSERRLKLLPGNGRRLIDAGFDRVVSYRFDNQNQIVDEVTSFVFVNLISEVQAAPDGKHFIYNFEGQVLDENLGVVGSIPNPNFDIFSYTFSEAGDQVFALRFNTLQIVEFSFPGLVEQKAIDLNYNPMAAYPGSNGDLIVVGQVATNFGVKTIIDVLEF